MGVSEGREARVGLVGAGPAVAAVEAALGDVGAAVSSIDADEVAEFDLAVVVDRVGEESFLRASANATGPWLAVELGGIGGLALPDLDAAVSVLDPVGGCFACLATRVRAVHDGDVEDRPTVGRADARLAGAVAGRLGVSALESSATGTVVELPHAERHLLPVPGCGCDPGHEAGLEVEHGHRGLEAAVEHAEAAVDDRLGIVTAIGEAHSFPAPYYLATLCDTGVFSDASASPRSAGVAVDWNAAFMKAVGEALERYSAAVYDADRFTTAAAADLDDAVDPSRFVLPGEGYDPPDADEAIPWVPGTDLHSDDGVMLPAEFVHFPPPAERHKRSITTGLGLGNSTAEALLAGLYEVVERDATMLAWYSTYEPLGLEVDDGAVDTLARRARAEDLDVDLRVVTQDVDVPVVTAAVHRAGDWPRFAVGSAADLDPRDAALGALCEAVQSWMELRAMGPEAAAEEQTAIDTYADRPPEVRSLLEVGTTVRASALGPATPPDGLDELEAVLDRLAEADLRAYAARLTPRDVEALGFEAVRVIVPAAQPLFTGRACFGERARRVPRDLGYRPRLDRAVHPYP